MKKWKQDVLQLKRIFATTSFQKVLLKRDVIFYYIS